MKTAIFWGTHENYYNNKPVICNPNDEHWAIAKMIEDYIAGAEITPGYILGVWDPIMVIEAEDNQINSFTENNIPSNVSESILYTAYYFLYYSPKEKVLNLSHKHLKRMAKILNICTGWGEDETKKTSFRLPEGILRPLLKLTKKQHTEFLKRKLIKHIVKKIFKPGKFWQYLQKEYNIDHLIIPSPIHWIIAGDEIITSCDHLPKIKLQDDGGNRTSTSRLNAGLVEGIKLIAEQENKSVTEVFKAALIA